MPTRMLRYCRKCLVTRMTLTGEICRTCNLPLRPLLDDHGAVSSDFLAARGNCCGSGCRNCPYPSSQAIEPQQTCRAERKTCQRCGAGFECQSENCWCNDVKVSPTTLKWLERNYTGCLCPVCLAEFATV